MIVSLKSYQHQALECGLRLVSELQPTSCSKYLRTMTRGICARHLKLQNFIWGKEFVSMYRREPYPHTYSLKESLKLGMQELGL